MGSTSIILTVLAILFLLPVIANRYNRGLSAQARRLLLLCLVAGVILLGAAIAVHLNE